MLNRVMCIGNLGRDPEIKTSQSGKTICNMSVGASENFTDKDGNRQTTTEWFRVVVFGKAAEACGKYLKKGSMVFVEGKQRTREYEKDGVKRYSTELVADTVQFLDRKKNESQEGAQGLHSGQPQQYAATPSESFGGMEDILF